MEKKGGLRTLNIMGTCGGAAGRNAQKVLVPTPTCLTTTGMVIGARWLGLSIS